MPTQANENKLYNITGVGCICTQSRVRFVYLFVSCNFRKESKQMHHVCKFASKKLIKTGLKMNPLLGMFELTCCAMMKGINELRTLFSTHFCSIFFGIISNNEFSWICMKIKKINFKFARLVHAKDKQNCYKWEKFVKKINSGNEEIRSANISH